MKYLIAFTIMLTLTGCFGSPSRNSDSAESLGIHIGDVITVKRGFYKDCIGAAAGYEDYRILDDAVILRAVKCTNGFEFSTLSVRVGDIK